MWSPGAGTVNVYSADLIGAGRIPPASWPGRNRGGSPLWGPGSPVCAVPMHLQQSGPDRRLRGYQELSGRIVNLLTSSLPVAVAVSVTVMS